MEKYITRGLQANWGQQALRVLVEPELAALGRVPRTLARQCRDLGLETQSRRVRHLTKGGRRAKVFT